MWARREVLHEDYLGLAPHLTFKHGTSAMTDLPPSPLSAQGIPDSALAEVYQKLRAQAAALGFQPTDDLLLRLALIKIVELERDTSHALSAHRRLKP
jgi:hypothetical protein